MTSYAEPRISQSDVLQESITSEEALRRLLQELNIQHPGKKPGFAVEFKSEEQTQAIATSWNQILSPELQDFRELFFPRRTVSDGDPAESSRRPSNAEKSPERGLIVVRNNPRLYADEKDKSDRTQVDSIWFGISLQSLSDLPKRYLEQLLVQTDGLSPYLDFFAGFLCVKFGDGSMDAMRDSWTRQAKTVLLSNSSLRRCNKEDSASKLAFVRSLKFFGYIIKSSVAEVWEMKVNDYRNTKHSKLSTIPSLSSATPSSSRTLESSSTNKQPNLPIKKDTPEPAPGLQPELQKKLFLATYHGTLHLNTQQGVQDFIKLHFALMEWVQNGGYTYVQSAHTQLWCSDPPSTPTDPEGLRLVMSKSETMKFLETVMGGAKPEEV